MALNPASVIFAAIWGRFGGKWAFFVSAGFSMLGLRIFLAGLMARFREKPVPRNS